MNSEREDNCTTHFLWTASKLIRDISNRKTSRDSDLSSLCTAFRAKRLNFISEERFHLCPKCFNPWKEGKFSMRIRAMKVKSSKKRINVQIIRCLICQNKCKSIVSKPERIIVNTNSNPKTESIENVPLKKKKKKKDKFAGLNIANISLMSSHKRATNKRNIQELPDGGRFTDVDDQNTPDTETDDNHVQPSSITSNKLIRNQSPFVRSRKYLIKDKQNSIVNNTINSRNIKKKERRQKNKMNELKNFINSL